MVSLMEKHANHLEQLVEERTRQLNKEKEKTDRILYRLLPPPVAELSNNMVEAEEFEEVTIFFSDIVGFTKLCSNSTPLEVVDFLNSLYVAFDEIITRFDVYKVETIGDAYMVVSGCPVLNSIQHAAEIASMALDLMSHMTVFRIRHRPEDQLQLRIGINTASTQNIRTYYARQNLGSYTQVFTANLSLIIFQLGGFFLEERGQVKLKRRGMVTTYWLLGKEGFNKPLQKPAPDIFEPVSETLDVYYAS
ncbi:predicted protein [Nematostella vectensis]|uniref:Guanylate cyclase domain-containing protein n=1 Tax=Nematostella vectensis TaxID=45351 RepID=A7RGN1_NEMVE|nr:predicted protein [Nematostella vectensis]|eukprot:XP_001641509.1 predicted protein [Nematostella vectensis]